MSFETLKPLKKSSENTSYHWNKQVFCRSESTFVEAHSQYLSKENVVMYTGVW